MGTERRLIAAIEDLWAGRTAPAVGVARGDDCAILARAAAGEDLLLTVDQVVENRHFARGRHPAGAVGRTALVRSLSDIASMGGRPLCFLQTVCLPAWAIGAWHDSFQEGMREAADLAGVEDLALAGGDVAGGDLFVATTTVVGRVESGTALRRAGARPGDLLCVSGTLGGSALGLDALLGAERPDLSADAAKRHCEPVPRIALGRVLREVPASAAIDISDGLAIDANRLASASGVCLVIDPTAVPLFPGSTADQAMRSGEEYELLFALPPGARVRAREEFAVIGRVERGTGVWLESGGARAPLRPEGHSHF